MAATNKGLDNAVKMGIFREDLYYRLNVISLRLPPLRERGRDILLLANYFIDQFNLDFRRHVKGMTPEVERLFLSYRWPGNVRELRNVIERLMILEDCEYILPEHLPIEIANPMYQEVRGTVKLPCTGINIKDVERDLIIQALEMTGWNQSRAARLLHLSRDAFRYRMRKRLSQTEIYSTSKGGKK